MATITQRGNSYRIRVSVGYDKDCKQIIRSMTWKPDAGMTKRQIEKELNRQATLFEEQCKQTAEPDPEEKRQVTFKELAEEYLTEQERTHTIKVSSLERLKSCRELTYKAIGNLFVDKIRLRDIQDFIFALSEKGISGKPLSEKSQKHYLTFISDVMNYAIMQEIIIHNPCRNVKPVKTEKKEKQVYTMDELSAILNRITLKAPTDYRLFYALAIYTGMRRGELLGLEWKDVDYKTGVLSIVRTSNYRNGNTGTYTGTPKTKGSTRFIHLTDELLTLFRDYKAEQDAQSIKCGDQWTDCDRVFITWNGQPMHPNTPYTWLQRFCESEGLTFHGIHAFRHAFATSAITSGKVDIKTISAILGHTQTSTTLNIYAHEIAKANATAIDTIADIIHSELDREKQPISK